MNTLSAYTAVFHSPSAYNARSNNISVYLLKNKHARGAVRNVKCHPKINLVGGFVVRGFCRRGFCHTLSPDVV